MAHVAGGGAKEEPVVRRRGKTWYDVAPGALLALATLALLALVVVSALGWLF